MGNQHSSTIKGQNGLELEMYVHLNRIVAETQAPGDIYTLFPEVCLVVVLYLAVHDHVAHWTTNYS